MGAVQSGDVSWVRETSRQNHRAELGKLGLKVHIDRKTTPQTRIGTRFRGIVNVYTT